MMNYMDFIAKLGVSAAHPGGFKATRELLGSTPLKPDARILEVGCGTGKTACYLAGQGFKVTALDSHPVMLEKAKERAEREKVEVEWVSGDLLSMPFADESFDIVFAESVTIFNEVPRALREYYRVLKPGGRLIDREIAMVGELPESVYEEIISYFRMEKLLSTGQWEELIRQAGYADVQVIQPEEFWNPEAAGSDGIQEMDISALLDPGVMESLLHYHNLMLQHSSYFGSFVFTAGK